MLNIQCCHILTKKKKTIEIAPKKKNNNQINLKMTSFIMLTFSKDSLNNHVSKVGNTVVNSRKAVCIRLDFIFLSLFLFRARGYDARL